MPIRKSEAELAVNVEPAAVKRGTVARVGAGGRAIVAEERVWVMPLMARAVAEGSRI